jgi:hypothetical protein
MSKRASPEIRCSKRMERHSLVRETDGLKVNNYQVLPELPPASLLERERNPMLEEIVTLRRA